MKKAPVFTIPAPSTATIDGPWYEYSGTALVLSLVLDDDGEQRRVDITFNKPRAVKHRVEGLCESWHVKEFYDTLCEVEGSGWVTELYSVTQPHMREKFILRHFAIYLDGFGCLEVIAESVDSK